MKHASPLAFAPAAGLLLAALTAPLSAPAATLHPGDVVLIRKDSGTPTVPTNTIDWVRSGDGSFGVLAQGAPISDPRDIAMRSNGTILVADAVSGLLAVDPASGAITTLVAASQFGSSGPTTLTLTPVGDVVVAGVWGVQRVPAGGGAPQVVSPTGQLIAPVGIAVDASGAIWVSDQTGTTGNGAIVRIDPNTGAQSALNLVAAPGFPSMLSLLRWAPDGMLYVMDLVGTGVDANLYGGIYRVDPVTGAGTRWYAQAFPRGFQMNVDGSATILYAYNWGHDPLYGILTRFNGATATDFPGSLPWGPMAVVPGGVTPANKTTWGELKVRYR